MCGKVVAPHAEWEIRSDIRYSLLSKIPSKKIPQNTLMAKMTSQPRVIHRETVMEEGRTRYRDI